MLPNSTNLIKSNRTPVFSYSYVYPQQKRHKERERKGEREGGESESYVGLILL